MKAEVTIEILDKLLGPIDPVGSTGTDNKRYENLQEYKEVAYEMVRAINSISYESNHYAYSVNRAGEDCKKWIKELLEEFKQDEEEDNEDA